MLPKLAISFPQYVEMVWFMYQSNAMMEIKIMVMDAPVCAQSKLTIFVPQIAA